MIQTNNGRLVYHYCAMRQNRIGTIEHFDGILMLIETPRDMDNYRKLKQLIVGEQDSPEGLVITSLSYLGRENQI